MTWPQCLPHSTADPERHSAGEPRPKPSTSSYDQLSKAALRRPVEPKAGSSRATGLCLVANLTEVGAAGCSG